MTNPVKSIYRHFTRSAETNLMQGRIFHRVCGVILITTILALIINTVTKIPELSTMLCAGFLLICALFYNSRILGNLNSSVIIFAIVLHSTFILNFFINSALEGPSLILFLVSLIFIIAVMPNRQYLFWVSLNVIMAVSLMCLDYYYPELIENSYQTRLGMYTDMIFSYIVGVACISIVLTYILRSFQEERKKTKDALVELAEVNSSKTKLLSIVSHDLKAPLNTIESFLEILVECELNEHEEKTIKLKLLNETKNTQAMLANMLSWTKSQMDGGIKVQLTPLDLQKVLTVPISIQQLAAEEKGIRFTSNIDGSLGAVADEEMIRLVVRNLLNNAVKFTNPGGEISIKGESLEGQTVLTIKDNGIGIPEEKQQHLFSLTSGTTYGTANEKGVGLGLKLCKEFIELQHGAVSFTSKPQKGTTFKLTLPSVV